MPARRQSRTLDALVILAVVLVAAASIVTWGPGTSGTPDPQQSTPAAPIGVSPCGWAWAPPATVEVELPPGATRMWICDGVMRKPVTQGIQEVVDQISTSRGGPEECVPQLSTGVVFLDYPDGKRVGFSWDSSCSGLGLVAGRFSGFRAAPIIRAAYEAQYGAGAPADLDDDPNPCRPRQFSLIDSRTLESLTLCRGSLDREHGARETVPVTLTPGDLARVMAGVGPVDYTEREEPPSLPDGAVLLRGVAAQGIGPTTETMWWAGDRIWFSGGRGDSHPLSAGARRILERYRDGGEPSAPAPLSLAAAGSSPCAAPPAPTTPQTLPDGPVAAWWCTAPGGPNKRPPAPDPLVLDPQALVDVYADMERAPADCESSEPQFRLVLRYPTGDVAVAGGVGGCRRVGARMDAYQLLDAFQTLLTLQRQTIPAPTATTPPSCGYDPDDWPTYGWLAARPDQVTSLVECATGAELPAWVLDDLRTRSELAAIPRAGDSTTLAAVAPDGSRFLIDWDGVVGLYRVNGQWYRWRPSPAAAEALP